MLVAVVARLQAAAGENALVGRLGGDEFGVALPGDGRALHRRRVVAALALARRRRAPWAPRSASPPRHATASDADALLRASDVALRVAKRRGKQQIADLRRASRWPTRVRPAHAARSSG